MASKMLNFSYTFLILILFFSSPILASSNTSSDTSHDETICNSTPHPSYCKSNLPRDQSVDSYLERHRSTLSEPAIRALKDCHLLAELNLDTLSKTYQVVNLTKNYNLDSFEANELLTLLSAVLTNQQISLEGLQEIRKLVLTISGLEGVLASQIVVVNPDGTGNFTTISDAVNAAPNDTNLMLIGDGTVITGNRSVVDGWTTLNSATFAVVGQGFVAINMTFRNTAGAIKHQAVAVRNGADSSAFYNCSFEGYQDTLYTHSLRQFYRDCDIYGTVDFIFGNAAAVLQKCNIYPRLPLQNQFNAITAQGRTDPNENTGTSIHNCAIRAANDLASYNNGTTKTYLGMPWNEYSRAVYMQSYEDSLIDPTGWREWSGDFPLNTSYYAEFNNTGSLGSVTM
ncbi:putative pectinesterase/pectinesterase inhibitor 41 [Morus notabilis]|uniref:Pectinesterase n=1 Tax=Morus notabilis TaxID=981085 RepID=W9RRX6_9ROSA|nr:putative pectinesterase/pectinesterase inhibitor 41 [Morus notabilis]